CLRRNARAWLWRHRDRERRAPNLNSGFLQVSRKPLEYRFVSQNIRFGSSLGKAANQSLGECHLVNLEKSRLQRLRVRLRGSLCFSDSRQVMAGRLALWIRL